MHTNFGWKKTEGMRPLRRHRHRWEDNIRMDFRKQGVKVWSRCIWLRTGAGGRFL
jgi:hypothetical protein